jgi:hypothetical protein
VSVVSRSADPVTACIAGSVMTRVDVHADWIDGTVDAIEADSATSPSCAVVPAPRVGISGWVVLAFIAGIAARRARRAAAKP